MSTTKAASKVLHMPQPTAFGRKLMYVREQLLNLSQAELGESLGSNQATIQRVEQGTNKFLGWELFAELVRVHHVNPFYFIYEDSNEPAILPRQGDRMKSLLQKVARYEKLADELMTVKRGKK